MLRNILGLIAFVGVFLGSIYGFSQLAKHTVVYVYWLNQNFKNQADGLARGTGLALFILLIVGFVGSCYHVQQIIIKRTKS